MKPRKLIGFVLLLALSMIFLHGRGYAKPAKQTHLSIDKQTHPVLTKPQSLQPAEIAVLYPDIGDPFRFMFRQMILGIEAQLGERVAAFKLGQAQNTDELTKMLQQLRIKAVITLGSMAYKQAQMIDGLPVVAGGILPGVTIDRDDIPIHSLTPEPRQLFGQLLMLRPESRRIFVVFNPQTSAWLIQLARDAAKQHNLELVSFEAKDVRTAARHYRQMLTMADPDRDAVWLLQDTSVVDDDAVLPLVLEMAWYKRVLVFSSSLEHVQKGALFTLYPNYVELGKTLAISAQNILTQRNNPGQIALRSTFSAINTKTAANIGLAISNRQLQGFSKSFPEPQ